MDPMGGLNVRKLIAAGGSQSGNRLLAYTNGIQPIEHTFDAIVPIINAGAASDFEDAIAHPDPNQHSRSVKTKVRDDLTTPVMQINSQAESLYYYTQRQPDTNFFRSWEIAGGSHAPVRTMQLIRQKTDRDGLTDSINTYSAIRSSEVNWIYTVDAAFQHINVWINGGDPPPQMQPMELSSTKTSYMNDQYGNAKGGIRLPELEVPIARYIAVPTIALGGYTIPFTEAQLKELYPTHEAYVQKVEAAAIAAKDAGVILPYRVEEYVKAAEAAPIPTSIMPNLK